MEINVRLHYVTYFLVKTTARAIQLIRCVHPVHVQRGLKENNVNAVSIHAMLRRVRMETYAHKLDRVLTIHVIVRTEDTVYIVSSMYAPAPQAYRCVCMVEYVSPIPPPACRPVNVCHRIKDPDVRSFPICVKRWEIRV